MLVLALTTSRLEGLENLGATAHAAEVDALLSQIDRVVLYEPLQRKRGMDLPWWSRVFIGSRETSDSVPERQSYCVSPKLTVSQ